MSSKEWQTVSSTSPQSRLTAESGLLLHKKYSKVNTRRLNYLSSRIEDIEDIFLDTCPSNLYDH